MGRELQDFGVVMIVMETTDMKLVLILEIQSCSQFWRQSMLCVVLSR